MHLQLPCFSSSFPFVAIALLAGVAQAQSTGPLVISPNTVIALGNSAPSLSLDGSELVARETGPTSSSSPTDVHIFVRNAGIWSQQQLFSVPNNHAFGVGATSANVSLRGTRLVIGVSNGVEAEGDARISEFSGGSWGPLAIVPVPDDLANFGTSVLTREGVVFVWEPDTSADFGSVHIFRKSGTSWVIAGGFGPSGGSGVYGTLLADSGDTLLVASTDIVDVRVRGATEVDWNRQALLDPVGNARPNSIAIDGDVAVVGSVSIPIAWHAEVFERSGTAWSLTASPSGSDTVASDRFGTSVSVHGDTIYIGAPGANSNAGAVYVFQRQAGVWSETSKLVPAGAVAGGQFGLTLLTDGATLAVGANASSAGAVGSLYLFDITSPAPTQTYCTAKVNSQGCTPQIGAIGVPGATNPNPFAITAASVINHKSGFVLYSIAGMAATPFQGGTLCLASPLHRTPAQNSGGNVGPPDCSGTYNFNFNARVQSGVDPALVPGVEVWAQYYSRDPGDPFMVGLTDAVTFTIGS